MRNAAPRLQTYKTQIESIIAANPEHDFVLSIYENDSTDNTAELLQELQFNGFKAVHILSETLGTASFGSTKEAERVKNLAEARNKATLPHSQDVDIVAMIEADITYTPDIFATLLNTPTVWDIVSAVTVFPHANILYDAWATRKQNQTQYVSENNSLHNDWEQQPFGKYASTFNGVCLYRADAFNQVQGFNYISPIDGSADCDTAVICQNFIANGYDNIYINYLAKAVHS